MTLQQFDSALKSVFADSYELAAPKGKARYVVWHTYGRNGTFADDRNQIRIPKVQIDIVTNVKDDALMDSVCDALADMELPFDVVSEGYDPEYNAYRTILQMVVI